MRIKIAHVADAHYGVGYPGPFSEARLEDIARSMDEIADRIVSERPNLCIFAGDAFKDSKVMLDRARIEIVMFSSWLRKLSAARVPCIVLLGTPGHDARSACDFLSDMHIPGVRIVTEPEYIDGKNFGVVALPSMDRRNLKGIDAEHPPHEQAVAMSGLLTNLMRNLHPGLGVNGLFSEKPIILAAHQLCSTARGADELYPWSDERRMDCSHVLSYSSQKTQKTQKTRETQKNMTGYAALASAFEPILDVTETVRYDLTCLGHIHIPQRCGERVFYSGAPERLSFGDEKVETGFWFHDLDTEDRGYHEHTFIPTHSREYLTLKFDPVNGLHAPSLKTDETIVLPTVKDEKNEDREEKEKSLRSELRRMSARILDKKIVRIDAKLTGQEFRSLSRTAIEDLLYKAGAGFVQTIETSNIDKPKALDNKEKFEGTDWFDPCSALTVWAEKHKIEADRLALLLDAYRRIAI